MKATTYLLVLLLLVAGRAGAQATTDSIFVPDFFMDQPLVVGDTTYEMVCYDRRDSILSEWNNFAEVRFLSVIKTYPDRNHQVKNKQGVLAPLPVQAIVRRYDRLGNNAWMYVNYPTHQYQRLTERRNQIVRTAPFKPGTSTHQLLVFYATLP
ncbi:MAG: hypothetical protein EBZ77_11000 [Chitinophagia bacterium]|nr:hypothetical protein [Chitinophagia bacterium]